MTGDRSRGDEIKKIALGRLVVTKEILNRQRSHHQS